MVNSQILYRKLEPAQIAFIKTRIDNRDQIPSLLDRLGEICGDAVCGDGLVVFHGGALKDGFLVEIGFPVAGLVETDEVHTRMLEAVPALIMLHHGPHQAIRETILKIYEYLAQHAWTTSLLRREIYHILDRKQPEKNVTEIQVVLHEWDRLFAESAEDMLGAASCQILTQEKRSITAESSFREYTDWIQGAIARLDTMVDDNEKKCQIVSNCAHVFPQERIEHLRLIYEQGTIDDVLREMYTDDFWYEKPVRRGNVLYMRKNPFDPDSYLSAVTPLERRKAYCHCPFVRPYLDEIPSKLSPTFCFCGAGWYRRLWEGILGLPVRIEHVETLLKGNDQCTLTITFPLELVGECLPER
jgi:effector-binding domain-containing protein